MSDSALCGTLQPTHCDEQHAFRHQAVVIIEAGGQGFLGGGQGPPMRKAHDQGVRPLLCG